MEKIKLHLGCGWRDFGDEWIHIDGGTYEHLDGTDITKLTYGDNTVDLIYASHVIAYFDRDGVIDLFKEWFRVLKPGGVLRLATPDFESIMGLYTNHQLGMFLGPLFGKMKMGENTIYHKTTWDLVSLGTVLMGDIGFTDVNRYDWRNTEHSEFDDHSQAYIPHMDKDNGTLISLNVECTK